MRIVFIVSTLRQAGPTTQLLNIIKYLDKKKFEPIIITLSPEPKDSMKNEFGKIGVKIISLNFSRLQGLFLAGKKLNKIIKDIKPDLIHTQGIRADLLIYQCINNIPQVLTVRNYPFYDYPMKFGIIKGNIMAWLHYNVINRSIYPVCCSKNISELFKNKHKLSIDYIQNGIDNEYYTNISPLKRLQIRQNLNLPENKKIFITVGSLIPRKNVKTIIKAFIKTNYNAVLVVIGDGIEFKSLKRLAGEKNNIIFSGKIQNIKEYLDVSDYFISASLFEGLPNSVLEAMSCGLPCLLSDIPSHTEILEYDSNAGLLFSTKNADELRDKINNIENINYKKASLAAIKIVKDYLNAKNMSEKYQALYEKVLNVKYE